MKTITLQLTFDSGADMPREHGRLSDAAEKIFNVLDCCTFKLATVEILPPADVAAEVRELEKMWTNTKE